MAFKGHGRLTTEEGATLSVHIESTSFKERVVLTVQDIDNDITVSELTDKETKALINCMSQAIRALG